MGAVTLLSWSDLAADDQPTGTIAMELSPVLSSIPTTVQTLPVGPESIDSVANQPQAAAKPPDETEQQQPVAEPSPSEPEPDLAVPRPTVEKKPITDPRPEEQVPDARTEVAVAPTAASQAMAPPKIDAPTAARSAAPDLGLSQAAARAKLTWHQAIAMHLDRLKRYPAGVSQETSRGEVIIQFAVERSGRVLSSRIIQSSGSQALDAEALHLLERATPLPRPAVDVPGETFMLTVPVVFRKGK